MEKNNCCIYGELGETITVYSSEVKEEGKNPHVSVGLELDGFVSNKDGDVTVFLSPAEAKRLANQILATAEDANEKNFKLLIEL